MAERVSMSDEMTSVDAGCTSMLLTEHFLMVVVVVLAGKDFRCFSLMRAEVRRGTIGPGESSIMMGKNGKTTCKGGTEAASTHGVAANETGASRACRSVLLESWLVTDWVLRTDGAVVVAWINGCGGEMM